MTDTTDLIQRLRGHLFGTEKVRTCGEAADALEQQAVRIEALRADAERLMAIADQHFQQALKNGEAANVMRVALQKALHCVPCTDGVGGFFVEHHSPDGEYLGTQNIDPMWVVQEMASTLDAALRQEQPNE